MGEKITKNNSGSSHRALAEAIVYLADQIREGCADIADGLRQGALRVPTTPFCSNQIDNNGSRCQEEKAEDFALKSGADEVPEMRDDLPIPKFGRKAE